MNARTSAAVLTLALALTATGCSTEEPGAEEPPPSDSPSSTAPSDEPSDTASPSPSTSPPASTSAPETSATPSAPPTRQRTVAGYYLGQTPQGVRLYREFTRVKAPNRLSGALVALQRAPADPDYRTPWADGTFVGAARDGEVVTITLADESVRERPAGMTRRAARVAVQQVVYTLQAAVQDRAPVQFRLDGNPIDQVYGVPTSEPLANAPQVRVLALVNVTSPEQGSTVGGTFTASGVASSFEATVPWQVRRGDEVVAEGFATAEGWMGRLYPWETTVDVSDLAPGDYTFVAMTDDPSGGEGRGPTLDSKAITVR